VNRLRCQNLLVQPQHAIRSPIQREFLLPALRAGCTHTRTQASVRSEPAQRVGQCCGVAGRHEQSRFAIANDEPDTRSGDRAGNRRQARAHRFEQHEAERFRAIGRRQAEHVGVFVSRVQCHCADRVHVDAAGETHTWFNAQAAGLLFQRAAAFTVADHEESRLGDIGDCAQQHVDALEVAQAADGEDAEGRAGVRGLRSEERRIASCCR